VAIGANKKRTVSNRPKQAIGMKQVGEERKKGDRGATFSPYKCHKLNA